MDERRPRFDVLMPDEMTALEAGRIVLEGELDATVHTHPWLPPGTGIVFDRDAFDRIPWLAPLTQE